MDAIISSALEEICAQGRDGLTIPSLCSKLGLSLEVKKVLWTSLLKIPTIQFQVLNRVYDPSDPSIRCFEDAEKLDLIITSQEKLHDNFLGIYDFSLEADKKEFREQRLLLERIASARTNGITQSQLSKEFGIEGNKIFYRIRKLEKSGLIVRQGAVERIKGSGRQGQATRLIHLNRFAKHLGSQQKFEVAIEEDTEGNQQDSKKQQITEDVLVKDYIPSMKAICDKLEEANGKVLVISDIKHELGYRGSRSKHRDWRNICGRLKSSGLVEEAFIKVNGKDEFCLRLLKKFSPVDFEQKEISYEGTELKLGRCQIANQLVELPIEHQIYDAIDAAGNEGMLINEVSQRFGVNKKKNHNYCRTMSRKFGMPEQKELHKKSSEYRIRTAIKFESSNVTTTSSEDLSSKNSSLVVSKDGFPDGSAQILNVLNSESDTLGQTNKGNTIELSYCSSGGNKASNSIFSTCKSQELSLVGSTTHKTSQSLTVDNSRREQTILEFLQAEKIVLRAELFRWLVNLEKHKGTTMGSKTVERLLFRLEKQGKCKCVLLDVNKIMKTDSNYKLKVVLHPSIQRLSSEVLCTIRDRLVSLNKKVHGQGSFRKKNINSVLVLDGIQRSHSRMDSDALALRMQALHANGFIPGRMVRAKLLHSFLWDYACNSSIGDDVLSSGRQYMFDLEAAIKDIPLELFLQVAGSTIKVDNLIEKFKKGVRLHDLSIEEYNDLNNAPANRRLSSIVSILQRLKLIWLVTTGSADDGVLSSQSSPLYVLELKPYIEEPLLIASFSNSGTLDLSSDRDATQEISRHDFLLLNQEAINEYWQALEYIYAMTDPKAALHVFPGSMVQEIFYHKSWASGHAVTDGRYANVLKLIVKKNLEEKLPYKDFKEFAKNLNLTLQQDGLKALGTECKPMHSFSQKRKRSAKTKALKHRKVDNETESFSQSSLVRSVGINKDFMEEENFMLTSPLELETQLQEHQEEVRFRTSEKPELNRDNYNPSTSHSAISKLKAPRQRRILWTDEADRKLVIQYVKHRGGLAAKFSDKARTAIWDLPAPPKDCRRRMSFLKQNRKFREALVNLCNMLRKHYKEHQEEMKSISMDDDGDGGPLEIGFCRSFPKSNECNQGGGVQEDHHKYFNDEHINLALEDVLQSKHVVILEDSIKPGNVSDSQFPSHTGSSAAKFSRWLCEREKDFMRGGITLAMDLQCGEIFHLFALVSSGELLISPCLPVEGVGEAEYIRTKNTSLFAESESRREKGFPGINLYVYRAAMPKAIALKPSASENYEKCGNGLFVDGNNQDGTSASLKAGSNSSHYLTSGKTVPTPVDSCESPWEQIVDHATHLMSHNSNQDHVGTFSTEVFKTAYTAIQKAGDQGLAITEVSKVMASSGEKLPELVIDVLQKFGRVEKVIINGSLHVFAGLTKKPSCIDVPDNDVQEVSAHDYHKDVGRCLDDTHTINLHEDSMRGNADWPRDSRNDQPEGSKCYDADRIIKKIIPKRIRSQTFRIVMQNPGILEDDIIREMDFPNPQHCKRLLRLMVREKHLTIKKMYQSRHNGVPAMLKTLIGGGKLKESKLSYREHFFANPKSIFLL